MRSEVDSSQLVPNVLRLLRELLLSILGPLKSLMGEALVADGYDEVCLVIKQDVSIVQIMVLTHITLEVMEVIYKSD